METDTECRFWSEWSSDRNAIIANGDTVIEIKESLNSFQKQNKKKSEVSSLIARWKSQHKKRKLPFIITNSSLYYTPTILNNSFALMAQDNKHLHGYLILTCF